MQIASILASIVGFARNTISLSLVLAVAAVITLAVVSYLSFDYGRTQAQIQCMQELKEQERLAKEYYARITADVQTLAAATTAKEAAMRKDMTEIIARLRRTPVTVIRDAQCYPSPTFLNSIDEAVNRANQR